MSVPTFLMNLGRFCIYIPSYSTTPVHIPWYYQPRNRPFVYAALTIVVVVVSLLARALIARIPKPK
jgi:hypothetical protein